MNPEYYEGIVLVTIKNLNERGSGFSVEDIVEHAQLGNKTISKAIKRLEEKKRITITPGRGPRPNTYEITDPPGDYDYMAASLHLENKRSQTDNGSGDFQQTTFLEGE